MTITMKGATIALALAGAGVLCPTLAMAQTGEELTAMGKGQLRTELLTRHDAAVAAMAATVGANDPRYVWAMQAKVQCGIALGFLRSSTKDADSIGKCANAYARMQAPPMAPLGMPMAPPTTVTAEICRQPILATVFFEFDSVVLPDSSIQTLQFIANNLAACGWGGLSAVGHTDRSGSDAYNDALSLRRGNAVAAALGQAGIAPGVVSVSAKGESEPRVPTPDGERNPTNRRVEISAR